MLAVSEARARILAGVEPLPGELADLRRAHGRVLAADLVARVTQPPFDTTAMDGYALRAADAVPGTALRVIGQSSAGQQFPGVVAPGEAVRIFTGAPMPRGADAVLQQELAHRDGDHIHATESIGRGRFIRRAGLDFTAGAVGLPAGRVLDPRALALAAAMNHVRVSVRRQPRIAVLPTGDELVPVGTKPGADQIIASSVHSVSAACAATGADVVDLGLTRDDLNIIRERIRAAKAIPADVLVTLGGASVGEHDLVKQAFAAEGLDLGFWKIAMRPGKPLVFGRLGPMRVLGLPGNPVSSYVCTVLFLVPLIRALMGLPPGPEFVPAVLGGDLAANDAREDYLRARMHRDADDAIVATPFDVQDSSMQAILAAADGLLLREPHAPAAARGSPCRVLPF